MKFNFNTYAQYMILLANGNIHIVHSMHNLVKIAIVNRTYFKSHWPTNSQSPFRLRLLLKQIGTFNLLSPYISQHLICPILLITHYFPSQQSAIFHLSIVYNKPPSRETQNKFYMRTQQQILAHTSPWSPRMRRTHLVYLSVLDTFHAPSRSQIMCVIYVSCGVQINYMC